jgi:hypothetical protein
LNRQSIGNLLSGKEKNKQHKSSIVWRRRNAINKEPGPVSVAGKHFVGPPGGVISVDERVEGWERVALIAAASVIHEIHWRRVDYSRSGRRRWRMRGRLLLLLLLLLLPRVVAIIRRVIIVGIERFLFGADHLLLLLLLLELMILLMILLLLLLARHRLRVMMDLLGVERRSGRGRQGRRRRDLRRGR